MAGEQTGRARRLPPALRQLLADGAPVYVVRSLAGRDRRRAYLATPAVSPVGAESALWLFGGLHTADAPKWKNIRHVRVLGWLEEAERAQLMLHFTPKTVDEMLRKFEQNGEFPKKVGKNHSEY